VVPDAGPAGDYTPFRVPPPGWNCGDGCFADASLPFPMSLPGKFGGAADPAAGSAPQIVYPLPLSVHPINIADLTIQWRRATAAQTLFRIRFAGRSMSYDFYAPCNQPPDGLLPAAGDECVYTLPGAGWLNVTAANRRETVQLTVAATSAQAPGFPVATSPPVSISFTPSPVEGGLYYWSTSLQGMYRLAFGSRKAQPYVVPGTPSNRFTCGGCHSISRDGTTLAFSAEQEGYLTVARTEDPTRQLIKPATPPVTDANMVSLNRNGSLVLVSYGVGGDNGKVVVRDTASGAEVARLDPAVLGTPERKVFFPEWSPDDKEFVATLASQDERPWSVNNGYLVVIPYNGGAFGPARVVVPAEPGLFHFYPTWSPDGRWIAFASAPSPNTARSYDNYQARLRLVSRDGGRVYELARATQGIGKASTWPKFAPFQQTGGQLVFLTYNSKIDYGFVLKNSANLPGALPQLWLSAIDLGKVSTGDPSSAPIWLPFQDVRQRNHLGYWTEKLPCTDAATGCGEGAVCTNGACIPIIQ
jgi:hypothetical protein